MANESQDVILPDTAIRLWHGVAWGTDLVLISLTMNLTWTNLNSFQSRMNSHTDGYKGTRQGAKCRESRQTGRVQWFIDQNEDTYAYFIMRQARVKTRNAVQAGKVIQRGWAKNHQSMVPVNSTTMAWSNKATLIIWQGVCGNGLVKYCRDDEGKFKQVHRWMEVRWLGLDWEGLLQGRRKWLESGLVHRYVGISLGLGLLYSRKQRFRSLKMALVENSFQGEDIQKLNFQCSQLNWQKLDFWKQWRKHPRSRPDWTLSVTTFPFLIRHNSMMSLFLVRHDSHLMLLSYTVWQYCSSFTVKLTVTNIIYLFTTLTVNIHERFFPTKGDKTLTRML